MRKSNSGKNQRGMALIIALLLLLLVSAVGLGMIYMSSTETEINANYKDTQSAFFAMRGGLEEMRERMRTQSLSYIGTVTATPMPTTQMPGTAGSIFYVTNPSAGEVVAPLTFGSTYFDDEFCHESFVGSGVAYVAPSTPCPAAGAAPAGSVTTVASNAPYTGTAASLNYKWIRLTLKQNGTFPSALVDSTQGATSQVCWNSATGQEVVASALGYANCTAAQNAGVMVAPLYLVTSLAITPQGSRRVGQYESAALNIAPPPAGLALDGPAPIFNTPHSANSGVNGTNGSSSVAGTVPPAVPGCSIPNPANSVPAIGANSSVAVGTTIPQIFRPANFTGSGPAPSVVDQGSDAGGTNQLANWSTPTQLNNLASEIGDGADQSFTCGINGVGGAACSGSYGTPANPQITYINGDVNLGGGAGVLVVTGTLTINGGMQWDGLILVIGQGAVVINGGGAGEIFGQLFVANTNSPVSPFTQLATLGSPSFTWNGGGKASISYNSCWADIGNNMHYIVVASREEMY